jgi:hypothetical protein
MATQLNILKKAAMTGDWTAMSAYADYLEEIDGDKAIVVGLRFCIKHQKFPVPIRYQYHYRGWKIQWIFGNYKRKSWLPIYFRDIPYYYKSNHEAIKAVGKAIIRINQDLKEVT